ncbi:MAG: hypothetical protein RL695_330, partial [Pseudomonadota bacterium]
MKNRASAGALLVLLLGGCAVGPEFKHPGALRDMATSLPMNMAAPSAPPSATSDTGEAAELQMGQAATQEWRSLGSPRLDALIEKALQHSPTLAAAKAMLRQADELRSAQAGATDYPQVDASVGAQRQQMSPAAQGQAGEAREFGLYHANVGLHYRLDLAGGNRRALEAWAARTDYRRHELNAARLTLAANLAMTAITRARLAGQLVWTQAIIDGEDEQIKVVQARVRLGQAAPDEILIWQTRVEQRRAGVPVLMQQIEQSEHLLATLSGQVPGVAVIPDFTLSEFRLPVHLPVVLPSERVRRRPDIQAAEALLHAANADHGVAVAKRYPQINLSASLGSQALTSGVLFGGGTSVWNVLGQLTQPLFNPGLAAEERASLAALDAASANYQRVVLEALRSVADTLRALEHDAQSLASLAVLDASAQSLVASAERQYA